MRLEDGLGLEQRLDRLVRGAFGALSSQLFQRGDLCGALQFRIDVVQRQVALELIRVLFRARQGDALDFLRRQAPDLDRAYSCPVCGIKSALNNASKGTSDSFAASLACAIVAFICSLRASTAALTRSS